MQIEVTRGFDVTSTYEAKAFDLRGSNVDLLQLFLPNGDLLFIAGFSDFKVEFTPEELEEMERLAEEEVKAQQDYRASRSSLLM